MVSYDEEKVTALSSELMQACERLRELGRLPREVFTGDPHLVASAKYHLIVGIEAAIDLANHVITKNRWKIPENYADTFRIMQEHGFFDEDLGERLQTMARFRIMGRRAPRLESGEESIHAVSRYTFTLPGYSLCRGSLNKASVCNR